MAQYYMLNKPRGLLTAAGGTRGAVRPSCAAFRRRCARCCTRSGGWTRIRKACCCLRTTACWTCACSGPSSTWKRNTNTAHSGICTMMPCGSSRRASCSRRASRSRARHGRAARAHHHRRERSVPAGALPREIPEKPGPARHGRQALDHGGPQAPGQADDQSRGRARVLSQALGHRPVRLDAASPPGAYRP